GGLVGGAIDGEPSPGGFELALVRGRFRLDRPQPHHVRQRAAQRRDVAVGGGAERDAPWQRQSAERASLEVALQQAFLGPGDQPVVPDAPLAEDLLSLPPVHGVLIVPVFSPGAGGESPTMATPEPGLDRHEWESELATLEPQLEGDPASALPGLADLVERMLLERGYQLDEPVTGEGTE